MKPNSLGYLVAQGVSGLWKNRLMTLASVGVLTACLLIVGFAVLLTENINQIVGFVEQQNEIVVFTYRSGEEDQFAQSNGNVAEQNRKTAIRIQKVFKESGMTEELFRENLIDEGMSHNDLSVLYGEQSIAEYDPALHEPEETAGNVPVVYWGDLLEKIQAEIKSMDNIETLTFVPKNRGLEEYKSSFGDYDYLLDEYTGEENPLPHKFVIQIKDLREIETTISQIKNIYGIKSVSAATQVASTLVSLRTIINIVAWSIIAALSVVSLVIIVNTIRASIFTRRKEINIMKYVGATNSFIRFPFIVEGFCMGLIAAAIAYFIIWIGYSYFVDSFMNTASSWIQTAFQNTISFQQIAVKLAVFFTGTGILLGVLGSTLSIRNHIKV